MNRSGVVLELESPFTAGPTPTAFCGASLAACGDVVAVGCPYAQTAPGLTGAVAFYRLGTALPFALVNGTQQGERFGTSLACDGARFDIGAPGHRLADGPLAAGAVFGVQVGAGVAASYTLLSSDANAELGHSVAADAGKLVVGVPNTNHSATFGGSLHVFEAPAGTLAVSNASVSVHGSASMGRLGYALAAHRGQVLAGAPFAGSQAGAAQLVDLATGKSTPVKQPSSGTGRFGAALALGDTLLVGAPKVSSGAKAPWLNAAREGAVFRAPLPTASDAAVLV